VSRRGKTPVDNTVPARLIMSTSTATMNLTLRPERRKQRRAQWWLAVLTVSAMGPYLLAGAGIRVEHLIIYAVGPLLIARAFFAGHLRRVGLEFKTLAYLHIAIVILITLRTVFVTDGFLGIYKLLADIENHVQPVLLILMALGLTAPLSDVGAQRAMRIVCGWIIVLLSMNTIVILLGLVFDTEPIVSRFVADTAIDPSESVSAQAARMGRLSGLFNQPFESGAAYSVGLFSMIYLLSIKAIRKVWWSVPFGLVMLGGIFSVSKAFIILGLAIGAAYFVWSRGYRIVSRKFLIAIPIVLAYPAVMYLPNWQGFDYFLRLFDSNSLSDESALSLYTAGRFGSDSRIIESAFTTVYESHPLIGFGFGTLDGAIDNGYLEYFYHGGICALALYLLFIVTMAFCARRALRHSRPEGMLAMVLVLFIVGADFGAPTLTMNRSSIFFISVFILSIVCAKKIRQAARSRNASDSVDQAVS
jgi:hypothetical protein